MMIHRYQSSCVSSRIHGTVGAKRARNFHDIQISRVPQQTFNFSGLRLRCTKFCHVQLFLPPPCLPIIDQSGQITFFNRI
jgi:hypothetical protein